MQNKTPPLWATISSLIVIGIALNLSVFEIPFLFDDISLLVINPFIRDMGSVSDYMDAGRPMRTLTLLFDYAIWGLNPRGYHVTSMILHLACAVILFRFFERRFTDRWTAWGAALLFAVHPCVSEAIAVVTHRKEMLALFFTIASLWLYTSASGFDAHSNRSEIKSVNRLKFALSTVFYLMGLASKQVVVILPLLVFSADIFMSDRKILDILRARWYWYASYLFYPAVFIILSVGDWRMFDFMPQDSLFGEFHYKVLAISAWSVTQYFRLMLWPIFLSADHQFQTPGAIEIVAGIFLWGGALIAGLKLRAKQPAMGFGLVWIPLNLLTVLNIIPANQPLADRYLYMPLAGFCLFLSAVVSYASRTKWSLSGLAKYAAICGFTIILFQTMFGSFYRGVVKPGFASVFFAAAAATILIYIIENAVRRYFTGSRLKLFSAMSIVFLLTICLFIPTLYRVSSGHWEKPDAFSAEKIERAEKSKVSSRYRKARDTATFRFSFARKLMVISLIAGLIVTIIIIPPWKDDREGGATETAILACLIMALGALNSHRLNEWGNNLSLWTATLKTDPQSFRANTNIGIFWKTKNDMARAVWYLNRAASINPRNSVVWHNLGVTYVQMNDLQDAEESFLKAIAIMPDHTGAMLNLANIYSVTGRREAAYAMFKKIIGVEPENARAWYNIAVIELEEGRADKADEYCRKALNLRPDFVKAREMCGSPKNRAQTPPP